MMHSNNKMKCLLLKLEMFTGLNMCNKYKNKEKSINKNSH